MLMHANITGGNILSSILYYIFKS